MAPRPAACAGVCLAALALQGCVAVVIPAVAAGAIARSSTDGVDARVVVQREQTSLTSKMIAADAPGESASARAAVPVSAAPRPAELPRIAPRPAAPQVAELVLYARSNRLADPEPLGEPPTLSAMLRDPAALDGARRECTASTPIVLIDLDPAGDVLDPDGAISVPAGLAEGLAELRAADIGIAWISGASAADAPDLRIALGATGLDPAGKDELLLMRYPGDRKQTRREDLAETACLIAIAGDERRDFDELYDYLVNPEAALALELLIGDGWFLLPPADINAALSTVAANEETER